MAEVTVRDADEHFTRILKLATEKGEPVVITEHGKPVAKLVPLVKRDSDAEADAAAERERRRQEALEWFRKGGLKGGIVADWTREELYDREADRRETFGCE